MYDVNSHMSLDMHQGKDSRQAGIDNPLIKKNYK